MTTVCDTGTNYAVQPFPGLTASEIARRVTAYAPYGLPDTGTVKNQSIAGEQVLVLVSDGLAMAECKGGYVTQQGEVGQGTTVEFTLH